ncbi:hypothetical protein CCAE64S_02363 [Castellaniella caeni]
MLIAAQLQASGRSDKTTCLAPLLSLIRRRYGYEYLSMSQ